MKMSLGHKITISSKLHFSKLRPTFTLKEKSASVHEIISCKHIQNDINYRLHVSREWFTWFRELLFTFVEILRQF